MRESVVVRRKMMVVDVGMVVLFFGNVMDCFVLVWIGVKVLLVFFEKIFYINYLLIV